MIAWTPVPSPDGVKPASWRIRLPIRIGPLTGPTQTSFFSAALDTGALWTTFTEDYSLAAGFPEVSSGRPTSVRWFGVDHPAWLHKIQLVVALDPHVSDTVTPEPLDVLFIRQFPHATSGRPVSLAVLGMDAVQRLSLTLDGVARATRF